MAAVVALVLSLGTLGNGLVLDDYFQQRVALEGRGYFADVPVHSLDMFSFLPSGDALHERGVEAGLWPWWVSKIQVRFFRPLSSLTHLIDYRVWPEQVWLMHLHSALWYACLAAVAAMLFREVLGAGWPAGLAAMSYAVDDGHAGAVGWLASRNMVVATTFGVLCLLLHHRARDAGWRPGCWLSPLALSAALLSAEFGVGCVGYLVAYAVFFERGAPRARLLSVAPHFAVLLGWQLAYSALGYGASGTGLYVHPLHEPVSFLIACAERGPVLLLSQLTVPLADAWLIAPTSWSAGMAAVSLGGLALFFVALRKLLVDSRALRFFAVGAVLAVVPNCSTFTNERMLFFVGLGVAAVVASLAERACDAATSRVLRGLAIGLLVRHVVFAPVVFPVRAGTVAVVGRLFERADDSLPTDAALAGQTLVVVNTPHSFMTSFPTIIRNIQRRAAPHAVRTLGATLAPVEVTRIDEHTIEISTERGYGGARLYEIFWERGAQRPIGHRVDLGDVQVEVVDATPDGRHRAVRFRFVEPLDSPRWRWVAWVGDGYVAFEPPAVGASTTLPAIDLLGMVGRL